MTPEEIAARLTPAQEADFRRWGDGRPGMRPMADAPTLPDWPAAMGDALAASYVGLGATLFRQVMERDQVAPLRPTAGRKLWRRKDLDRWLDRQAGDVPASEEDNPWHRP